MLSILDTRPAHHCQGFSRREFLRIGSLAMSGLALPHVLQQRAQAANGGYLRNKSVVLLFLQGGAPHIEFFDPKMSAPAEIRSITGEISTRTPGVTFGSTFPTLAAMTDRFSIVRSYGSGEGNHTYREVLSGRTAKDRRDRDPNGATVSSVYARVRGTNHPKTGLPTNILVLPEAVNGGLKLGGSFETSALPELTQSGSLGASYTAFNPSGGGNLKSDMELRLSPERLSDRRTLLGQFDRLRYRGDASGAIERATVYEQQAFDIITRGVADAFDLSKEDPRTVERYDTSRRFNVDQLTQWPDMRRASSQLGRQMLLARRLIEAGCGFVTVSDCGWDFHANQNSPKNMAGIYPMGGQVDHAVGTFLEDLRQRGMSDDVLLIVTSEMGRSPRINNSGGREHHSEMTTLLLAGGGLKMGQVVGQSDRQAARAITEPYRPEHLFATVMHTLFDISQLRLDQRLPRDVLKLTETGQPIHELI